MTAAMYTGLADLLNEADQDDNINVVLLYGAGDSFSAGNDPGDFAKNFPGPGDSPQARLIDALIRFTNRQSPVSEVPLYFLTFRIIRLALATH